MARRRPDISMSAERVAAFLAERRHIALATVGPRGWPHVVPMWYLPRGRDLWVWTYAKSQKVRNLRRDDRATLQAEDGTTYDALRGVMIEARTEIVTDTAEVHRFAVGLYDRYAGGTTDAERAALLEQARKRVALRFEPVRTISWDHARS